MVRVTATNAFSARRLLPILPDWRAIHRAIRLNIVGTDGLHDRLPSVWRSLPQPIKSTTGLQYGRRRRISPSSIKGKMIF